jgi:murein DD-endopeptidase MepM/ murein hydrolase activator NlpD
VPLGGVTIPAPAELVDGFRVPPYLLPLYQAAGARYGVDWELLAAINEIETDFGRNLRRSSAGAVGWMQFMPSTWARYGVDADRDGVANPDDPVDAIFSAARYLAAAGAARDVRGALLAYNHAGWYADWVLRRAALIRAMPGDVVGSLTGLGAGRLPLAGPLRYGGAEGGPAVALSAAPSAPVLAVADGAIARTGRSAALGRFLVLRDAYGNRYTYGGLAAIARGVRAGRTVAAGRTLARLGSAAGASLRFEVRPAGRGAPPIPARPILSGWGLLARLHADRVLDPAAGPATPALQAILRLGEPQLAARVLSDPEIRIYPCGRLDIKLGRIDRRVLAAMLYLDASGLHPTISSLECGHSLMTVSGNVSEHSTGTAMDIAAVNGSRITPATQGPGSIAAATIERLLALTGAMRPHQIISLMSFPGTDEAFAMADHGDHIHVGWRPGVQGRPGAFTLSGSQWRRLAAQVAAAAPPAR